MIKTILLTFGEHGYDTQVMINGEVRNDLMAVYIGVRASDEPADIILQTVEGGGDVPNTLQPRTRLRAGVPAPHINKPLTEPVGTGTSLMPIPASFPPKGYDVRRLAAGLALRRPWPLRCRV